jgi:GTP-binding protein
MPTIVLVGRPNVGKSTLFNRLVGRRAAIVADAPGTTRDRREGSGRLADLDFTVIDTAGWEEAKGDALEARMRRQTERAVKDADAVLLLIDARAGVTPLDRSFAQWLRAQAPKTVLVANKCEGGSADAGLAEAYGLGLGEPVPLSAEHGLGLADLRDALAPLLDAADDPSAARRAAVDAEAVPAEADDAEWEGEPEPPPDRPLQLAIVGRPNVGKSTLLNRLLGEERVLTGPEAGITRDAIAVDWRFDDRRIRLIDTAGLRRRAHVSEKLEALSARDTQEAVRFADVVVLVLDASQMLEKQDLAIARDVVAEGRGLVIAVNKIDALGQGDAKAQAAAWRKLRDRLQTSLAQVKGVPIVGLSARSGRGVDKLMPAVMKLHALWNRRVPTAAFNRWLGIMVERNPPPLVDGRRIRIRYGAQIKSRPPTFALFVSRPTALPESYARYLVNGLRDDFDLPGVPIRIVMRKPKNPFVTAER